MSTTESCPTPEELLRYVAGPGGEGALPDAARAVVEVHAADCASCRETLVALGLSASEGTPEEETLLRELLAASPDQATPGRSPGAQPRRVPRGFFLGGFAVAAAAAAAAFVLLPGRSAPEELLRRLPLSNRPTEARSALGLPYAPFRPTRGGAEGPVLDATLAELLQAKQRDPAGAAGPLAMFYLLRAEAGDLARAEAELAVAPAGAASENERGLLALASGRLPEALGAFDRAAALDPALRAAAFNRGVVLERLGDREAAAAAWRAFLASAGAADHGWAEEARSRLSSLSR